MATKSNNKDYQYIALIFVFLSLLFAGIYLIKQRVFTYGDGRMEKVTVNSTPAPDAMQEKAMMEESTISGSDDLQMKIKDLDSINVDEVTSDLYQNSVDANNF